MSASTVHLGGELSGRSILGGNRNMVEWTGLAITWAFLAVVQFALREHMWTVAVVGPAAFAALWAWSPHPSMNHRSLMGRWAYKLRYRRDVRTGRADLNWDRTTGEVAAERTQPSSLGKTRLFEIDLYPGSGRPERILIVRHRVHGQTQYVATFEFRSRPAGVMTKIESIRNYEGWSRFKAALARQGSLVRGLQQTSHIAPYDAQDHTDFIVGQLSPSTPELLVRSYSQLLGMIESETDQNRTWLTAVIPSTGRFARAVGQVRLGEDENGTPIRDGQRAIESVLAAQLRIVISRARAQQMDLRALDEKRAAAVMRGLQDPDRSVDDVSDASRSQMWLPWVGSEDPRHLRVIGSERSWMTRTAIIPRDGFAAGELPVDLLVPLLTGVSPSVIRTVSSHFVLIPASQARGDAVKDVGTDESVIRGNAKTISDGTAEAQMSVSRARLRDLQPASGHHGADWAMALTIYARSEEELEDAQNRIEEAAGDSHISNLVWMDHAQHLARVLTLPLGAGLKRRKVKS